jgi:hypothetical protein
MYQRALELKPNKEQEQTLHKKIQELKEGNPSR